MCTSFASPGSISFHVGRLKRDLLHTSTGAKYAPGQTPWSALERNPMHFIRAWVIQSATVRRLWLLCVFYGDTVVSFVVASCGHRPTPRNTSLSSSLSGFCAPFAHSDAPTFLLSRDPSGYEQETRAKRGNDGRARVECLRSVSGVSTPRAMSFLVPEGSSEWRTGLYALLKLYPSIATVADPRELKHCCKKISYFRIRFGISEIHHLRQYQCNVIVIYIYLYNELSG